MMRIMLSSSGANSKTREDLTYYLLPRMNCVGYGFTVAGTGVCDLEVDAVNRVIHEYR